MRIALVHLLRLVSACSRNPEGGLAFASALGRRSCGGSLRLLRSRRTGFPHRRWPRFRHTETLLVPGGSGPALCTTNFVERYAAKKDQRREDLQVLAMKAREDNENSGIFEENIGLLKLDPVGDDNNAFELGTQL